MATDYQGIKIYKDVIIVEKQSWKYDWSTGRRTLLDLPQGYIVEPGNKKMLETAMSWAKQTHTAVDAEGNFIYDEDGERQYEEINGIQNIYINGNFKFELFDDADGSSQGGKLSFWNCIITAPDNKRYKVGISSEILLNLLKQNTFVDGICDKPVWLGRIKGQQVGAFTDNMQEFKQAQNDQLFREQKNTVKYIPGDIIKSKTETLLYLGKASEYFSKQPLYSYEKAVSDYHKDTAYIEKDYVLVIDNKPFEQHYYLKFFNFSWTGVPVKLEDFTDIYDIYDHEQDWYIEQEIKKLSRVVVGHIDLSDLSPLDFEEKLAKKYMLKEQKPYEEKLAYGADLSTHPDHSRFLMSKRYYLEKLVDYELAKLQNYISTLEDTSPENILNILEKNYNLYSLEVPCRENRYKKADQIVKVEFQDSYLDYFKECASEHSQYIINSHFRDYYGNTKLILKYKRDWWSY
jgi:hypothetical protein